MSYLESRIQLIKSKLLIVAYLFLIPTLQRGNAYFFDIPLSAAGRLLFGLNQKVSKKFKYAVMQINER